MTDRRFIEESFPVKEVGEASAREKNIRHGHISTLHIWWARRPLAASRATAYAALTPAPKDIEEWQRKRDFIIQICQWENLNNQQLLERARKDILGANGGSPPKVLDPFAGGGSYPLEVLRLGCEAYANDYNPVAVLIEKATLEYPQKFGRPFVGMPKWVKPKGAGDSGKGKKGTESQPTLFSSSAMDTSESFNPLLEAVRYWGEWVLEEARKELAEFYPPDSDGSIPVGYIWARTITCQNPACRIEIPLIRQFWLAKKDKKNVALYLDSSSGKLLYRIVGDGYQPWPEGFAPEKGTIARAVVTCPMCGTIIDDDTTRNQFQEGKSNQRMVAVVLSGGRGEGKSYRIPTELDEMIYRLAEEALHNKREQLTLEWGLDPIPDEPLPPTGTLGFRIQKYGMVTWGDLLNARQLLSPIVFIEKIRTLFDTILSIQYDPDFAKAVVTYLAFIVSRIPDTNSTLCHWDGGWEKTATTFGRQALPMNWDYIEANVIGDKGYNFENILVTILTVLQNLATTSDNVPIVTQSSAAQLPYPDGYFDAILTDPPYYDNVPYSYLSDFFYVWLKRAIGYIHQDLFSTPLSPKANEIVAYSHQEGGYDAGKRFFEENLKRSFREMQRVLKPNGVATIVYAHKSTEGWETVINSLLDSGLVITGAWPLNTEQQSRLRASESAALASSIYIVARKMPRQPTGFYNDVRAELRRHLDVKLHRLWEEGISGADFFIAAIGSAIEVFGKYEQVIDYEGNVVRADRLLEEVRTIATDYAVRQILHNGFVTEISPIVRLYVLWRWNYGEALVPFDEGRKLAQSCGIDLAQEWNKGGFIKKEKEFIRLLGPQQRNLDNLEDPRNMIDVLHKALLLWERGKRTEMVQALVDREYGRSEAFYRVAQAISETLPNESKEKKLLDGFLAGRERVREEVEKSAEQGRLFE